MAEIKVNAKQKQALAISMILATLVSFWFLRQYIMLIVLSAIVAILFNPVYQWLMRKGFKPGQAAATTTLASILVVIIPIIIISIMTVFQIQHLADSVGSGEYSISKINTDELFAKANSFLADKGIDYTITSEAVTSKISEAVQEFGKIVVENIISSVSGLFALITTAIIYLYVFISMLKNQNKIIDTIKKINPLGNKISDLYIGRINAMTKATIRGQLIIAIAQGLESAIVLSMVGLSDLFFFFLMLLTILSVIPLGAGIVTIPIGIILMATGNIAGGIIVIANHLLIVTNIDNVLRPKLISPKAKLDSALMILSVFAGIGLFGFIGIVVGPVIMIVLITTLQVYLEVFKNTDSIKETPETKRKSKFISRIKFWDKK